MFPYHDENETERIPFITFALIGLCLVMWIFVQGAGMTEDLPRSVCEKGLIAAELTGSAEPGIRVPMGDVVCKIETEPNYSAIFTSMFLHGSWLHLLGNMWFLWLFGNNIEDSMSRPRFLAFYLICGVAAAMLQVWTDPASPIPMVGASGAISGVMGAYLVLFPRVKVYTLIPLGFFITTYALPAWVMLIYWVLLQFLGGFGGGEGGVAFWAHVGGFAAGIALVYLFVRKDHLRQHQTGHWHPA
jgi:membrane associated rhomboid family serine protease